MGVSVSNVGFADTPFITPHIESAVMSMVVAKTEVDHCFVAFSDRIIPLVINKDMTLDEVMGAVAVVRGKEPVVQKIQ